MKSVRIGTERSALVVSALVVASLAGAAWGQTVRTGRVILAVGDVVEGSGGLAVQEISGPSTNNAGDIGIAGEFDVPGTTSNDRSFVWINDAVVWTGADAPAPFVLDTPAIGKDSMGLGPTGQWAYGVRTAVPPATSGVDSIWANGQLLAIDGQPAPGTTRFFDGFSRPSMGENGVVGFMGFLKDTPTGGRTGRALYRATPGSTPTFDLIYETGGTIEGKTIRFASPTLQMIWDFSDDHQNIIQVVGLDPSSTLDDLNLVLNQVIVASENQDIPDSSPIRTWRDFRAVAVNDSGTWAASGRSDDAANEDELLTINGREWLEEGQTVDGVTLASAACVAVSLNNQGKVLHAWNVGTGSPTPRLVALGDVTQPGSASTVLVRTGDTLDVTGDGAGDYQLLDLLVTNTTSQGLDLGEDGTVVIRASVRELPSGTAKQAIVQICPDGCPTAGCPCPIDYDNSGSDIPDVSDIIAFFEDFNNGLDRADVNCTGSGSVPDVDDLLRFFEVFAVGC